MLRLLVFKENLKVFYGRYDMIIMPFLKFILVLCAVLLINSKVGYLQVFSNPFIPVIIALFCTLLPYGAVSFVLSVYLIGNVYSVSAEMAIVTSVLLLIVGILYYGFQPGDSYLLMVVPMLFALRIPYSIPLLVGLGGNIGGIIPVCCGILIYQIIVYINANVGVLSNETAVEITKRYMQIINGVLANRRMLLMMVAFSLTICLVYLIRSLSVRHSWSIAIGMGLISLLILFFAGNLVYNIEIPVGELLLGLFVSGVIAAIFQFFVFAVDYSRTEFTQFEDDEYYYYVKAVPKITVSVPDVKVQRINSKRTAPAERRRAAERTDQRLEQRTEPRTEYATENRSEQESE